MWVDAEAVYQAFVNLVRNALDAMPGGGRLTLRVVWSDEDDVVRAGRQPRARRVRVEIQDSGPGISTDNADRVFNPFFTTKVGGTGLGLALTHKIVEDHGGTIDFRNGRAGGTVFRIVLSPFPDPPAEPGRHGDDLR
jgi:signal transduction histidine kinase